MTAQWIRGTDTIEPAKYIRDTMGNNVTYLINIYTWSRKQMYNLKGRIPLPQHGCTSCLSKPQTLVLSYFNHIPIGLTLDLYCLEISAPNIVNAFNLG